MVANLYNTILKFKKYSQHFQNKCDETAMTPKIKNPSFPQKVSATCT